MLGSNCVLSYEQKNENCFSCEQIKPKPKPGLIYRSSISYKFKKQKVKRRYFSLLKIKKCEKPDKSSHAVEKRNKYKTNLFLSKYIVNMVFERPFNTAISPFNHLNQSACKIYRCQVIGPDDTCCCSCNSDAIFEVMKGLYNCYKKKNCLNCNCILCGDQKLQGGIKMKNERMSEKFGGLLTVPKRKSQAKRDSKDVKHVAADVDAKHVTPVLEGQMQSKIKLTVKPQGDLGLPVESTTKATTKANIPPLDEITPPKEELIQKNEEPNTTQGNVTQQDVKLAEALTPSQRKNLKHKEKLLRNLVKNGLPLPIGRTPSEKKLIDIVRVQLGLPQGNETLRETEEKPPSKASVITLLEGKPLNKGVINAGDSIPEGEILFKKDQINKMVDDSVSKHKLMIDKMRHRKSSGLLTPLKGKTLEQKEKILIDLVKAGLPLPEPKTASEKYLVDRIQNKVGLAPRRNISSVSIALENMTPAEKEIILKRLKDAGLPLPEPERKSKDADILAHKKSKDEDILTPLEGLPKAEKHKIVKRLAQDGVTLPEGKTISERSLIRNVKAELGMAPTKKRRDHKSVIIKAKAEGLFSPISDKPHEEKVRIIRGLAKAELPVPKGKTPSEKDLIKRIKDEFHWLTDAMHYKTKKESKNVEEIKKPRMNITQNYQAVIKTATCERGCGCNKRNIKLKNSHTKFRVAFSDIPTSCDRPLGSIPGGKRGYFVDNKGIKIIVGSAVGAPSMSRGYINRIIQDGLAPKTHSSNIDGAYSKYFNISKNIRYIENYSRNYCGNGSKNIFLPTNNNPCNRRAKKCVGPKANMKRLQKPAQVCKYVKNLKSKSTAGSSVSILVINSEASLSLDTSSSHSMETTVTSDWSSDITSHSKHCSSTHSSEELLSISSVDGSTSEELIDQRVIIDDSKRKMNIRTINPQLEYAVFRLAEEKRNFVTKTPTKKRPSAVTGNIVLFNRFSRKFDISKLLDKILARKRFTQASSLFVVVPTSDEDEDSNKVIDSTSICSVETPVVANSDTMTAISSVHGPQVECGSGKKFYMQEVLSATRDTEKAVQKDSLRVLKYVNMDMKNKYCQFVSTNDNLGGYLASVRRVAVDTTLDRPCCCLPKISSTTYVIESATSRNCYVANVSRQVTPLLLKDRRPKWCRFTKSGNVPKTNPPILVPCISSHSRSGTTHRRNRKNRLRSSSVSINERLNKYNYIPAPCECNSNGFDLSSYQTAKVTVNGNYSGSLDSMRGRRSIHRSSIRNTGGGPSSSSSTSDERNQRHNRTTKRRPSVTIKEDVRRSSHHSNSGASFKLGVNNTKRKSESGVSKAERKSSLKKNTSGSLSKIRKKDNEYSSSGESTSGESSGGSANSCASQETRATEDACFGTASISDLRPCPVLECPPRTRCKCKTERVKCKCLPNCQCGIFPYKCEKEKRKCGCEVIKGKSCACVEHYVYGGPRPGPTSWTRSRGMVTDFRGPAILHARKVCEYKRVLCDEDIEACECPKIVCDTNNFFATCPCGEHTNAISLPGDGPKPSTKTVGALTDVMGSDIFRLELRFCPAEPTINPKQKKKCKILKGCVCQDLHEKGVTPNTPPCNEDCTRMPKPEKKKICIDKLKNTDPCTALEKLKDVKRDPKKNVRCQTDPPKKSGISNFFSHIGKKSHSMKNPPCPSKDNVSHSETNSPCSSMDNVSYSKNKPPCPSNDNVSNSKNKPPCPSKDNVSHSKKKPPCPSKDNVIAVAGSNDSIVAVVKDSGTCVSNTPDPYVAVRKNVILCKCKPFCKCVDCTSKNPRKPKYYDDDYTRPCAIPVPKKPCECKPYCRCLACTLMPKCRPPKAICECKKMGPHSKTRVTCKCMPNCECGIVTKAERASCECKEKPVSCECIQCLCRKGSKSKKKSVTLIDPKDCRLTCAIDELEPEPEPEPEPEEPEPEPVQIIELPAEFLPEGQVYETVGPSCAWIKDTEALLKIRSELTMTSSGFKAFKTKQLPRIPPEPEVEMDFAQAIRYFASLNPVRFRELMIQERYRMALEEKQRLEYIEEMKLEAERVKLEAEKRRLSALKRKEHDDKIMRYIESLVGEKIFKIIKYLKDSLFTEEELDNLQDVIPLADATYSDMGAEADLDPAYWYPEGFKLTIGYNGGATPGNPNPNCT